MTAGIYKIENKINHKIYIGCSQDIEKRWYNHKYDAFNDNQNHFAIHQAFRKYGINNFSFSIIEIVEDKEKRFEREKFWIKYYDSYKKGYNETLGGDTGPEISGELNPKAKLTNTDVFNIRTRVLNLEPSWNIYQDYKNEISYSAFKKIIQGKTWKNILPNAIKIAKTEQYKKINKSESSKRIWYPNKLKPPKRQPNYKVYCITTNELFDSVKNASEKYGFSKTALYNHLNGKTKSCGVLLKTNEKLKWKKVF